jgi:F-type H+-transporting ATPase subunit epsilon
MVKHNQLVTVAVRRAFKGDDLTELKEQINEHFLQQGEAQERHSRLQQRLESGFLRRFADFRHA